MDAPKPSPRRSRGRGAGRTTRRPGRGEAPVSGLPPRRHRPQTGIGIAGVVLVALYIGWKVVRRVDRRSDRTSTYDSRGQRESLDRLMKELRTPGPSLELLQIKAGEDVNRILEGKRVGTLVPAGADARSKSYNLQAVQHFLRHLDVDELLVTMKGEAGEVVTPWGEVIARYTHARPAGWKATGPWRGVAGSVRAALKSHQTNLKEGRFDSIAMSPRVKKALGSAPSAALEKKVLATDVGSMDVPFSSSGLGLWALPGSESEAFCVLRLTPQGWRMEVPWAQPRRDAMAHVFAFQLLTGFQSGDPDGVRVFVDPEHRDVVSPEFAARLKRVTRAVVFDDLAISVQGTRCTVGAASKTLAVLEHDGRWSCVEALGRSLR